MAINTSYYEELIKTPLFKIDKDGKQAADTLLAGSITQVTKVEVRKNPVPLDAYSIFPNVSTAEAYAKTHAAAYAGQYIAVVDITQTPYCIKPYVIGIQNVGTENEQGCLVEIPTGSISVDATTITLTTVEGDDKLYYQNSDIEHEYTSADEFPKAERGDYGANAVASNFEAGTYLRLHVGSGDPVYIAVSDLLNFDNYVTTDTFNNTVNNINTSITSINNKLAGGFDTSYDSNVSIDAGNYIGMTPNVSYNGASNSLGTLKYNIAVAESSLVDNNDNVIFTNTSLATDGYVKEQLAWHCIEGTNDEPEPEPEP